MRRHLTAESLQKSVVTINDVSDSRYGLKSKAADKTLRYANSAVFVPGCNQTVASAMRPR